MDGYLQVCLIIVFASIISGLISGYKNKNFIKESLFYAGVYYYAVSAVRMFQGHATEMLGHAMKDKNITGYAKMFIFIIIAWLAVFLVRKIKVTAIEETFEKTVSIFWMLQILTVICFDIPSIKLTVIEGVVSLVLAVLYIKLGKHKDETEKNSRKAAFISVLAWTAVHTITAPTEVYAYNARDFLYRYIDFMPYMIMAFAGISLTIYLLSGYMFSNRQNELISVVAFSYTFLSYIQTMFFNGDMSVMEGISQNWSECKILVNATIWIIIVTIFVILCIKNRFLKICIYGSYILIVLQLLGAVSLIFSQNLFSEDKVQLTYDKVFELGKEDNVVVFILDTYDVQMINTLEQEDPDILKAFSDFTLYDNMVSRFGYTDGSLPYLLTGIYVEDYTQKEYDDSTFFKDMKAKGIDIRLITEGQYVKYFDHSLVDNISSDWKASFEAGKIISQLINCARYRGVPFALKDTYSYNELSLATCIDEADFYMFGDDQLFFENMSEAGVSVSSDYEKAFRLYHIYGAHSPYYFRESMTYDYSSQKPKEQWKAALKTVEKYLEDMKDAGCYDDSTIIIMADHGPNDKQRASLERMNISFNDKLRPIFFIKRAGEKHDSCVRDHRQTSHDDFCATVMRSFDDKSDTYGIPVWERQ